MGIGAIRVHPSLSNSAVVQMRKLVVLLGTCGLATSGCSEDQCGPAGAPAFGLIASSPDLTLTFGDLMSGQNNDCTDRTVPDVVISLTLQGTQMDSMNPIVFCVPRPDDLSEGVAFGDGFRFEDFNAEANGCTFELAKETEPTGTARASGLCDDGANPAGYALTLAGSVMLLRTCSGIAETIPFQLRGTTGVRLWE